MKKKLVSLLLLFSLMCVFVSESWADLRDFKRGVEKEEEDRRSTDKTARTDDDDEDGFLSSFFGFFFDVTLHLWFYHNYYSCYSHYPYSGDTFNHVCFDPPVDELFSSTGESLTVNDNRRESCGNLYMGGMYVDGGGSGGFVNFNGKLLGLAGVDLEYRAYYDQPDMMYVILAGPTLPVFQTDPLSLDFYCQYARFIGILERDGFALGIRLLSYPFRPVSIDMKLGGIIFEYSDILQYDVKLGFHLDRYELFVRYSGLFSDYDDLHAIGCGVSTHF